MACNGLETVDVVDEVELFGKEESSHRQVHSDYNRPQIML